MICGPDDNYSHGCGYDGSKDQVYDEKNRGIQSWAPVDKDLNEENSVSDVHIHSNETIRKSGFLLYK